MANSDSFEIVLAKEDFKFSSAHFTIFSAERAELLHGHNYRVRVTLRGRTVDRLGFLSDVAPLKRQIRASCARLDERTLLPADNPHLEIDTSAEQVDFRYGGRSYSLPQADVLVLPVANTTMELLARMLWQELAPHLRGSGVETLVIGVEETSGQGCSYVAPLVD